MIKDQSTFYQLGVWWFCLNRPEMLRSEKTCNTADNSRKLSRRLPKGIFSCEHLFHYDDLGGRDMSGRDRGGNANFKGEKLNLLHSMIYGKGRPTCWSLLAAEKLNLLEASSCFENRNSVAVRTLEKFSEYLWNPSVCQRSPSEQCFHGDPDWRIFVFVI